MSEPAEARYRRAFVIIVLAGFALRLAWALLIPLHPVSDGSAYDELAWNLATLGSYQWNTGELTAYWPVGTAFIYSLPYRLFGHHFAPLVAMNLAAGTAVVALIMAVARQWLPGRAALAAGALYALWPSQIEFTSIMASELWFNLAVLLGLWAMFASPWRSWALKGLLAGLCFAAAAYVRPLAIPLVLLAPVGLVWSRRAGWRGAVTVAASACVAMALCIAPWAARNAKVFGEPVLISTNGPPVMWMGNNPAATGEYMPYPDDVQHLNDAERSKVLGERARDYMIHHPVRVVALSLKKLVLTHNRETIGIVWNEQALAPTLGPAGIVAAKIVSTVYWWMILALAIAGALMVVARERWRGLFHPALTLWAYFAGVHAVTLANDRYHFPSIPYMAMLAGLAALPLLSRFGAWRAASAGGTRAARGRTTAG